MIPLPGIIKHFFAKSTIDKLLVSIIRVFVVRYTDSIIINFKSIMRPKTIIKSKWTKLSCQRFNNCSCRSIHLDTTFCTFFLLIFINQAFSLDVVTTASHLNFSFIERSYSNSDFNTHKYFTRKYKKI